MPSEIRHKKKDKYYMISPYMWNLIRTKPKSKLIGTKTQTDCCQRCEVEWNGG